MNKRTLSIGASIGVLALAVPLVSSTRGGDLSPTVARDSIRSDFPLAEGWSAELLDAARRYATEAGTTSVVVIHEGRLVLEWGDTAKRTSAHSVRKSLVSALFGIAVDRGLIDIDDTLQEIGFNDQNPPLTLSERQASIRDLLGSRSGIYHDSVKSDMERNRPERGEHAPGTFFYYNNWSFNALGAIFEQLTGRGMGEAFEEWIALPIGMQDFRPCDVRYETSKASQHPSYRFWISARDLARVGVLYANDGMWGQRRILSAEWIRETTHKVTEIGFYDYGLLWWTHDDGTFLASGTGGQKLLVDPAHNLVVSHRVDTGMGLRRAVWFKLGKRVSGKEFVELVDRFVAASPWSPDGPNSTR